MVTGPARLLALRLHGFKSFADRTIVEFGGGISAIVGPNGSGKSNLADALRWALGEQGRALRSRKSEDVIFAGSERRAALGMADVVLVLDNADGLLPVEYSVLELGRRLYRSGENDYLLNKQRVRLKDLVELLDGAHLADNAFLFIGQGMVDQALALRPEERRPLFEEVAGVRRHERRRRKAEEQLIEAEGNLARVEDILAELRPQARRLAAQAEQQASRVSAGEELAAALVSLAHARWHDGARRATAGAERLSRTRAEADRAMAELQSAEAAVGRIAGELGARSELERERREAYEQRRAIVTNLQLRQARLIGDGEAVARDRRRLEEERAAAEADLATQRRELALPMPERDAEAAATLSEAERLLSEALAELADLRAERAARGDELLALRRAEAARSAEIETARRRLADADRRRAEEQAQANASRERWEIVSARLAIASERIQEALEGERAAAEQREATRVQVDEHEASRQALSERESRARAELASVQGRLAALEARLAEEETRGVARAARRRGGRRIDEELHVEPPLRAAVEAALGEAARGYLVDRSVVPDLAAERGVLVVSAQEGAVGARDGAPTGSRLDVRDGVVRDQILALGGGILTDAVRRDPTGAVTSILARCGWVPALSDALEVQRHLPPGWIVVSRDGSALVTSLTISLGRGDTPLERRAEAERLRAEVERISAEVAELAAGVSQAADALAASRKQHEDARRAEQEAASAHRQAEDAERAMGRDAEAAARESAWHEAQAERLATEVRRLTEHLATQEGRTGSPAGEAAAFTGEVGPGNGGAIEAWDARVQELRARRDRLADEQADRDRERRDAEARRARALAAVAMDEDRIARSNRESAELTDREHVLMTEGEALSGELAAATEREGRARAALDELRAADAADRDRLATAEAAAATARDRLRDADERLRGAEVADLEARLGLDAIREQIVVELAGLGEVGLRRLEAALEESDLDAAEASVDPVPFRDPSTGDQSGETDEDSAALENAIDRISTVWARESPPSDLPTAGRLGHLRRRYHELGAGNPFAVDEYAALKARLEHLETQQEDLRAAIGRTRQLIDELNVMIAGQFRSTFQALESAFDARFRQLFGGGFARLTLTDPTDLSVTGIEIVARPPGKKAQALAMLSGGERALTAVALLFAMLEVRPVPFCVLDEVDAALDEANIGRFSDALRSLSGQTQFIVITHNRGTIEAADALYGVTVGEDSVSRVISLRLEEAQELADRGRDVDLVAAAG